jgi:hypothetical protein
LSRASFAFITAFQEDPFTSSVAELGLRNRREMVAEKIFHPLGKETFAVSTWTI